MSGDIDTAIMDTEDITHIGCSDAAIQVMMTARILEFLEVYLNVTFMGVMS